MATLSVAVLQPSHLELGHIRHKMHHGTTKSTAHLQSFIVDFPMKTSI
jgi:hypothetical protein